jgi:16S rRNA pseudouridine516 synthase
MRLVKLVSGLGYGSQKDVRAMIRGGRVTSVSGQALDVDSRAEHADILLDGCPLDPPPGMVLMLNKPTGFTCSTADPGRVVYELLPPRFARRKPVIAPVGRLDRDTSGLLLMTDDGDLLHRVISPRAAIRKVYRATLARPLRGDEAELFASGTLVLRSETKPLLPAVVEPLDQTTALVAVVEGRYHQVRRMFAAVGNHVLALHRTQIGGLALGEVEPGLWRLLGEDEVGRIFGQQKA